MAKSVDITERQRARKEAEARVRQQANLADFARRAAVTVSAETLMSDAVRTVVDTLGVDFAEVCERLPGGVLVRAGSGWKPGHVGSLLDGPPQRSVAGRVLATQEGVRFSDLGVAADLGRSTHLVDHGVTSGVCGAIPVLGEALGVLGAYTTARRDFTTGDVQFIDTMAAVLGSGVCRCRATEEASVLRDVAGEVSRRADLTGLLNFVQWKASAVLPCEAVAIFLWDAGVNRFRPVSHCGVPAEAESLLGTLSFDPGSWLARHMSGKGVLVLDDINRQAWLPPDLLEHFPVNAVLAAPLRIPGRDLGLLAAFSISGEKTFEPAQIRLCEDIANLLSMAVGAAALDRHQVDQAEVAETLARVGAQLISLLGTPALMQRLCEVVSEELKCDSSETLSWNADAAVFTRVARSGLGAANAEGSVPRDALAGVLTGFEQDDVVQAVAGESDVFPSDLLVPSGGTVGLFMALRRRGEVIGVQTASYRGQQQPFSASQVRVARGIARLASMAIEYAYMVDELERLSHLKSEFVATMSHQLRTPLHVIVGYNDLLLEGVLGSLTAEQAESLQHVSDRARELLDLIMVTLRLTELEGSGLPHDVDVADVMGELENESSQHAKEKGVEVAWSVAADMPRVRTDRAKLKVVVQNLLDNAIKFTSEGGRVRVVVAPADGGVEVAVSDTGRGIAPDLLPVLFEPFRGAPHEVVDRPHGVGLGLYTVRRLLEMLNGRVQVGSSPERGTTFRVWIPLDIIAA